MQAIRVLLVDDDPVWVKSLEKYIVRENDILVTGVVFSKEEALELVKTLEIDIILMDINLSNDSYEGISAVAEILEIKKIQIIMLSCISEDQVITSSFSAGAIHYITKENYMDIPNVIRSVFYHKTPFEALLKEFVKLKKADQLRELTDSEKEIFMLLENGYSHTQVEKALSKSRNTVKTQVRSILKKLKTVTIKETIIKVKSGGILN